MALADVFAKPTSAPAPSGLAGVFSSAPPSKVTTQPTQTGIPNDSLLGIAKNTVTGLPAAAGKVAQYIYDQGVQLIAPGITPEEANSPSFLTKQLAPQIVPAAIKIGSDIVQHPVVAAQDFGKGVSLGALNFLSNAMVNYIPGLVPDAQKAGTVAALNNTFEKTLFPQGISDIGKGSQTAGQAAIPIVASTVGGEAAGGLVGGAATKTTAATLGNQVATYAGGAGGFALAGQSQLPYNASIQDRAQNALDSLIQQGLFTAGSYGASLAKGMIMGSLKMHGSVQTPEPSLASVFAKPEEAPAPTTTKTPQEISYLADEYLKTNGNVINTDNARELFPSYQADRTTSADVHEDASAIAKAAYVKLLNTKRGQGNDTVLFTAGGTGVGKSSAIASLGNPADFPIIYDTNMAEAASASKKIDQALAKGFKVEINYVHNDISTALDNAMGRADRMAAELGSGRTVPLHEHINTHYGSPDAYVALAEKYKGNPDVNFVAIDNTGNSARAIPTSEALDFVKSKVYNKDNEQQHKVQLKEQIRNSSYSPQTKQGFLGETSRSTASERNSEANGGKHESAVQPKVETPTKAQKTGSITKTASDINDTLVKQGFEALPPELQSKFTPESYKKELVKSRDLVETNYEDAVARATGEKPVGNYEGQILFNEVEREATVRADGETLRKLAASPLGKKLSLAAQTLGAHGYNDNPNSGVRAIQEVQSARDTVLKAKDTDVVKEKTKDATTFKKTTKATRSPRESWAEFAQKITCNI